MKSDLADRMKDQYDRLYHLGRTELERRVRFVLAGDNPAHEFIMAMGGASFSDQTGELLDFSHEYLDPVFDFLNEWDENLKLTGDPMRIKGFGGPVIKNW